MEWGSEKIKAHLPPANLLIFSGLIFCYSLISPFISKFIETKGVPLEDILQFHWNSGNSLFGPPFKIGCYLILPLLLPAVFATRFFQAQPAKSLKILPNFAAAIFLAAEFSQISYSDCLKKILPLAAITSITAFYIFGFDKNIFARPKRRKKISLKEIGGGITETLQIILPFLVSMALLGLVIGSFSISGLGPVISYALENLAANSLTLGIFITLAVVFFLSLILKDIIFTFAVSAVLLMSVLGDLAEQNSFLLPSFAVNIFLLYLSVAFFALLPKVNFQFKKTFRGKSLLIGIPAENLKFIIVFLALAIMIILDQKLLLTRYDNFHDSVFAWIMILAGALILSACCKGKLIIKNSRLQALFLLVIACTVFYPKLWINLFYPAYQTYSGDKIFEAAEGLETDKEIKVFAEGMDEIGEIKEYVFLLPLGEGNSGEDRLKGSGLYLKTRKGFAEIKKVIPGSTAEDLGLDPEFTIRKIGVRQPQPNQYLPLIPAFVALALLLLWQAQKNSIRLNLR